MEISRRAVLGGIGQTAAFGALAASLSQPLRAAQPAAAAPKNTYCLAMMYPAAEGVEFNADLFRDKHLPLLKRAYGPATSRIELRVPPVATLGAPAHPILATVNVWFQDIAEFNKRASAAANEIKADITTVTKAPAMVQWDQVLSTLGEERIAVPVDSLCLSTYFPAKEGATIDAKYFAETFYPKMAEMYGPTAIRRIEVTTGAAGSAGAKPLLLNSAHVYIREEAAFDEAHAKFAKELFAEAEKYFTNIQPLQTLTTLHAVG